MHDFIERIARLVAYIGGVVLTLLVLLTCVSVLGRGLNTFGHSGLVTDFSEILSNAIISTGVGPVTGDFELVEAGIAFAIFAFLPICQLKGGHATVDVFASFMSDGFNKFLRTFWEVLLTAVIILITWRLYEGMVSKMEYGETTFLLQFPVWWAYAASFVAAVVASLVGVYCAAARMIELFTGRHVLPTGEGAVH
ncbi:TRAP transporter small permease [Roseibium sediminis]|uniref:TRAP transporter small permease n=1 Tax=Roseibium sediminis TaxID=1775174 RepID=UPI00123DB5B1|nr:TRAP transporter small permease [Roseibium sediminis]